MTRSFYWYQNICSRDLGLSWNWPLSEAPTVFDKHNLFIGHIRFFQIDDFNLLNLQNEDDLTVADPAGEGISKC